LYRLRAGLLGHPLFFSGSSQKFVEGTTSRVAASSNGWRVRQPGDEPRARRGAIPRVAEVLKKRGLKGREEVPRAQSPHETMICPDRQVSACPVGMVPRVPSGRGFRVRPRYPGYRRCAPQPGAVLLPPVGRLSPATFMPPVGWRTPRRLVQELISRKSRVRGSALSASF